MQDVLEIKLRNSLYPIQHLSVENTSYLHKNHKAYNPNSHFYIVIVSDKFNSLNVLQRHKLVYSILNTELKEVHSISLKLLSSSEFEKVLKQ